jgi:transposase
MFIREYKTKNKKNGSIYITHKLVESYQTEKGPRQRIVMNLGALTLPKSEWKKLSIAIENKLSGQMTILPISPTILEIADKAVEHNHLTKLVKTNNNDHKKEQDILKIDLNSLATINHRSIGPELVAHNAWNKLDFGNIFTECGFDNKQKSLAEAVIIGRLINPSSDIESYRWFQNRSGLSELLATDLTKTGKDAFYNIVDDIIDNKKMIEKCLAIREGELYKRSVDSIFLYDLTNTYFEGACLNNSLAHRGKCKSKRSDCPLVTLAVLVDQQGFPILSQMYKGNQSEPETLDSVIIRIEEELFGNQISFIKPTFVMDRGIATSDNIKLMTEKGYPYIVIERGNIAKLYEDQFDSEKTGFEKLETSHISSYGDEHSVFVKKIEHTKNTCRVLCVSEGKESKENAIKLKKEIYFLDDVKRLNKSIETGYIKGLGKVMERIGRIKERHSRISNQYNLFANEIELNGTRQISLVLEKAESPIRPEKLDGCYVIETTHTELTGSEIWKLYMSLTRIEGAFRAMKSELGFRPVHHQKSERTDGHLFISVLAYHLLNSIEIEMGLAGDNRIWSTLRAELSTHQRSTVVMTSEDGSVHHIRMSGTPESEHKRIYDILKVKDSLKKVRNLAKIGL